MSYNTPLNSSPAVSVIIPMYNTEKYISECLESLLAQTFTDFEVIVVDDCSTDNSMAIVKSYIPKFDGRLILSTMEKNMGNGGISRNRGFFLSKGEYIQFLDADDALTKTALEELYTLAKDYDADVVYCEKPYVSKGVGEAFINNMTISNRYQHPPFVDKPTLESEDLSVRVKEILHKRYGDTCWNKFIRRNLMLENNLLFPHVKRSEDTIWSYGIVFYAKKILRVPNVVYIYRLSEGSVLRRKKTAEQNMNFYLSPVFMGLKSLDDMLSKHEFFKSNPSARYAVLNKFGSLRLTQGVKYSKDFSGDTIYQFVKNEFGEKLGMYDVLVPMLFTALCNNKKAYEKVFNDDVHQISDFMPYCVTRVDIKLISKNNKSNFEILSVSDDKAKVTKPNWIQKSGIGYVIYSYIGSLKFIAKASIDGQIKLNLRGLSIINPENKKRIHNWVDYTKLSVNGQTIFDTLTSVWHDEPYLCNIDAKANEEITVEVECIPHKTTDEDLNP